MNIVGSESRDPSRLLPVLAVAIFLLLQVFAFSMSGPLLFFIDILSTLLVVSYILAITLVKWPPRYGVSFWQLFSFAPLQGAQKSFAKAYFVILSKNIVSVGVCGTFVGLVVIFANLDDPNTIGPGLAVAILTIVHAYLAKFLFSFYGYY